jgi:predicted nuclease of restriction endonuclease-like (RecB) superfamily
MSFNFDHLADHIVSIQNTLSANAVHAVNLSLTARNWLIGWYIVEYEQNGEDRAQYGEALLKNLAKRIHMRGLGERRLYEFRQLYNAYPQLGEQVLPFVLKISKNEILRMPSAISEKDTDSPILRSASAISAPVTQESWQTPTNKLFNNLPASHLLMLSNIKEPLKRAFYEHEAITGCWTYKELDRQISSLYFERMGLSKDKELLHQKAISKTPLKPHDIIRDPVTLEFLQLPEQAAYTETELETAILNNLQRFLLEMGNGFCFEARQKRILIDNEYSKADLIFYHRILKCHLIIELKTDRFRHEYASQLNMYLNYYRHEVMQPDDNPPVGLLLCTDYGKTTVQYATEGLSDNLFVSKYRLQLPSEEDIEKYLDDRV